MDYEKAYKEALERANSFQEKYGGDYAGYIFPELRESEDEKIRRALIDGVRQIRCKNGVTQEQMLAYLEKQKEQCWMPTEGEMGVLYKLCYLSNQISDDDDTELTRLYQDLKREYFNGHSFENMFPKQKEPHYTKRNALFDECVKNCDPKTVEEVNKRVDDIMNMPELSAFEQALTNFIGYWEDDEERWPSKFVKKHGKHILDMAREELQKEMKPVEYLPKEKAYDIMRNLTALSYSERIPINSDEYRLIHKITEDVRGLLDYPIEQKPAEWSGDDGMKPAEWSEEDRLHYANVLEALEYVKGCKSDYDKIEAIKSDIDWFKSLPKRFNLQPKQEWNKKDENKLYQVIDTLLADKAEALRDNPHCKALHEAFDDMIDWLKSLRNRVGKEFLQPHWKPSEEQMKALLKVVDKARELHYSSNSGYDEYDVLRSLYKQLKEL